MQRRAYRRSPRLQHYLRKPKCNAERQTGLGRANNAAVGRKRAKRATVQRTMGSHAEDVVGGGKQAGDGVLQRAHWLAEQRGSGYAAVDIIGLTRHDL